MDYDFTEMFERGRRLAHDPVAEEAYRRKQEADEQEMRAMIQRGLEGVRAPEPPDYSRMHIDVLMQMENAEAVNELRSRAEAGDGKAQFYLGRAFYNGQGLPQDFQQAESWFRKAADKKSSGGHFFLGIMYRDGKNVPQDAVLAYALFTLATAEGHTLSNGHRDRLALVMTSDEIAEAQSIARKWQPGQLYRRETSNSVIIVIGILIALIGGAFIWKKQSAQKAITPSGIRNVAQSSVSQHNLNSPQPSEINGMKKYYLLAMEELKKGITDPDLKKIAIAQAGTGVQKLFVRHYIQLRAKQLLLEENNASSKREQEDEIASAYLAAMQDKPAQDSSGAMKIVIFALRFVRAIFGFFGGWQVIGIFSALLALLNPARQVYTDVYVHLLLKPVLALVLLSVYFLLRKAINSLHAKYYSEEEQPLLINNWRL